MESSNEIKVKLWNRNFFLLWQGQLVSVLGDVIYLIALDFWILEMTGSTALMGLLGALSMAPRIILGPFTGVFVDRWDRKKIIVLSDFIRGVFVTFIGIAALLGFIKVWMMFLVGIILGICSAIFNPAISSITPDIVHGSKLVKANSVTSLGRNGMDMIGSAVGGILYITIGPAYMFLFNGISYLFSAFTESFMKVPKVEKQEKEITFKDDIKVGFKFLKDFRVLRNMFILASLVNFFANSAIILIVPYFKEMPHLGISKYGFFMTMLACGAIVGSLFLSIVNIPENKKFKFFATANIIHNVLFVLSMVTNSYFTMLVLIFIAMFCNVCVNTIFSSSMMAVTPSKMRGKVMAIVSTVSMGLVPIGKVLGGVLGEFFPVKIVIISLFICCFICGVFMVKIKDLRKLIEYDSSKDDINQFIEI